MRKIETMQTISVCVPKGAKNIRAEILKAEGKINITFNSCIMVEKAKGNITMEKSEDDRKLTREEYIEKYFPTVKASELSLKDEFLKHTPETKKQEEFKEELVSAIKSGLSDFRAQRMDPSLSLDNDDIICYHAGMKPAVGKLPTWWQEIAERFMPEKQSRLGTRKERIAFLGLLIKYLIVEKGYTLSGAWKVVCDQSKELGHYCDSEDVKHHFEETGNRQVGEWYDLGNTFKITVDGENEAFSLFGGDYEFKGSTFPLGDISSNNNSGDVLKYGVGWIVLSA